MTGRPAFLREAPKSCESPTMDALSDVLRVVRLNGAIYLDGEFAAPWCVNGEADAALCASFLGDVERAVSFHFITAGSCWAYLSGERHSAIRIDAGDIVVVPRGEMHILGSSVELTPDPSPPISAEHIASAPGEIIKLTYGGGGEVTRMVCGFLGVENVLGNPLLAALPRLFKVNMRGSNVAWLESSLHFAARETAQTRAGSATVLGKLSELLFVEAIRRYIDTLSDEQTGWLAGLRDRFVGRALAMMHARPAHPWTVDDLAGGVGLSRSALAQRFTELVGAPPMHYLGRWRLQVAAQQLRSCDKTLAVVAEDVGYDSESAFNRAFKREFGMPPAAWRKSRVRQSADRIVTR
jgi:AraC-like DNA-binding protein